MADKKPACERCAYWIPTGKSGECRRYPPVLLWNGDYVMTDFPSTYRDVWCGEFDEKESYD